MSPRMVVRLGIVLIVLVAAAVWSSRSPSTGNGLSATPGGVLLPGLDVNAVASIIIRTPDENVHITRKDDTWVASSLYDYPADFSKIRSELRGLSDLKVGQVVRGGDDLLDEFGLSTNVTEISLQDAGGGEVAALRLGADRMAQSGGQFGGYPDGQYLRVADGPVVLVPKSLTGFSSRSIDWVDTKFVQVPAPDIVTVGVTAPDEAYVLHIGENNAFTVEGMGENETVDASTANRLRGALNYLTFSGVADPVASDAELGMDAATRYEVSTRDGFTYVFLVGAEAENGRHVRVTVQYTEPAPPTREDAAALVEESEGEEEAADSEDRIAAKLAELTEAHTTTVAEAKKKADDLAQFAPWTFVISTYNADAMTFARDKLVKIEEPEPKEDSSGQGDT